MGCGGSKAQGSVDPQAVQPATRPFKDGRVEKSAKSNNSNDSGFDDGEALVEKAGGCAFDMTFGPEKAKTLPPRLIAMERAKTEIREPTMTELVAKLKAAEKLRSKYNQNVVAKMQRETSKVGMAARTLTRERTKTEAGAREGMDQAEQNRERHLKGLQKKLKEKDAKAEKVRATKKRLSAVQPMTGSEFESARAIAGGGKSLPRD